MSRGSGSRFAQFRTVAAAINPVCTGAHVVAAFVVDEAISIIGPALARRNVVHGLIGVRGGVRPQACALWLGCHLR